MSSSSKSLGTQFEETDWLRDMGSTPSNDGRTRKAVSATVFQAESIAISSFSDTNKS